MDLSEFEVITDRPIFYQLRNPATGKKMEDENGPVGVEIFGQDSEVFRAINRKAISEGIEKALAEGEEKAADGIGDHIQERSIAVLKACIHKFRNISIAGKELVAPDDLDLFLTKLPWAKDQVDKAIANRKLFMVASQQAS